MIATCRYAISNAENFKLSAPRLFILLFILGGFSRSLSLSLSSITTIAISFIDYVRSPLSGTFSRSGCASPPSARPPSMQFSAVVWLLLFARCLCILAFRVSPEEYLFDC